MSDSDEDFGPKLPPSVQEEEESSRKPQTRVIGPTLPPSFERGSSSGRSQGKPGTGDAEEVGHENDEEEEEEEDVIGPQLPSESDPSPAPGPRRAPADTSEKKNLREEWMTVIPKKLGPKLGFQSVTCFSRKQVPICPEDEEKEKVVSKKEVLLTEALDDYTKSKRSSSLLNLHQEKRKKAKPGADSNKARMPLEFDPEADLSVKEFSKEQQKSILDKAKFLNTRFSAGSSKFL